MALYNGPGDTLAGNLSLIVENYRQERERYWSDDDAEAMLIRVMEVVAQAMLAGSSDLTDAEAREPWEPAKSRWGEVVRTAESEGYSQHLAESVEIQIGNDSVNRLFDAPQRCLELATHILVVQPAEPVRRYLSRLGRCYIAGFLPECVILCRAVLENAVNEALERRGGEGAKPRGSMSERLSRCQRAGWIDAARQNDAVTIWKRGNKAVHEDPHATSDAFGTIVLTMGVLVQLYDDL
jgi:hypothetical protein